MGMRSSAFFLAAFASSVVAVDVLGASIVMTFGTGSSDTDGSALTADGSSTIAFNHVFTGSIANLKDTTGAFTGISETFTGDNGLNGQAIVWTQSVHQGGAVLTPAAPAAAIFPTEPWDSYANVPYAPGSTDGESLAWTFSGLSTGTPYTFKVFTTIESPYAWNPEPSHLAVYGAASSSGVYDALNNAGTLYTFANVLPDADGKIRLVVGPWSPSGPERIGALEISTVPEPASLGLLGLGGLALLRRRK